MLGDLRARAVRTRWESFNRQLSAFRLAYDISGGAIAKWLSRSVSPLHRQHVLTLSPAQEAPRARRLRSGMTVLWRRDCEGDCRSWRIATCCFDAVAHDSVTLLRKPMSLNRVIKVLSSCLEREMQSPSIAIHVLPERECDRIPRRFAV
jgi:hypothetical protein